MESHGGAFERAFSSETSSGQRPRGCVSSGGFLDFQPNGLDGDLGAEKEDFGLSNDFSAIWLPQELSDPERGV